MIPLLFLVDEDETEYLVESTNKPIRRRYGHGEGYWFTINADSIALPKGSIERLIGRKLTWKDEPFEFKDKVKKEQIFEPFAKPFINEIIQRTPTEEKKEEFQSLLEASFEQGRRAALLSQLQKVLSELGYTEERSRESFVVEREAVIAALRSICADFGDNDWDEDLHLADVLNKHLAPYLKK